MKYRLLVLLGVFLVGCSVQPEASVRQQKNSESGQNLQSFVEDLITIDLTNGEIQERLVSKHVQSHFQKEETPSFEVSLNYFPPSWTDIAFVDQNKAGDIARYAVTWERNRSLNGTVVYLVLEDNTWKYYTFVSSQLGVNTDENRATAMDDLRLFAQEMTLLDSFSPTSTPNILSEVVIESQTN